jgi:hypothetical protein
MAAQLAASQEGLSSVSKYVSKFGLIAISNRFSQLFFIILLGSYFNNALNIKVMQRRMADE